MPISFGEIINIMNHYKKLNRIITFVYILLSPISIWAQQKQFTIPNQWKFSCNDSNNFRNATVPGSVFTDLMNHKIISDPFLKDNEKDCQWVSKQTWTYSVNFDINPEILKKFKFAEICFLGIDTYADVYLNSVLVLSCNNALRPWKKEVKSLLKSKDNQLKIVFPPIEEILEKEAKKYSFTLPEGLRVFARKPQFHFGWDWAPKILNISIYKAVYINFWNGFIFDDIVIHSSKFDHGKGILKTSILTRCEKKSCKNITLSVHDQISGNTLFSKEISFTNGKAFQLEIPIENIKQWSIENPNYYDFVFQLSHPKWGQQSIQKRIGFRSISLKQPKDDVGSEFYFELNDKKIFAKGANWVPADVFRHRITDDTYRKLLIMAKDAGFNMIRVWGGGYYEDESFYNLCDSLGILVWQDFMFACSMYPFDEKFVKSVEEESIYQLQRLSNHPSIAIWCGNNENTEGWFNWGWQKEFAYSIEDSLKIWKGNYNIFYKKMPEWCHLYNFDKDYHPSSPSHGWGRKEAYIQGDVHYWGVWWGYEVFEKYFEKVGRFVSEYGFQGYPHISTLEYMMQGKIDNLLHPHIQQHQKHPRGQHTIDTYMIRDFEIPNLVEDYVYVSQMLQSEGVGKAIAAHRLAMPYCMGTLYWQFNDCWPSISWASVDVFNQPKAFHFRVKDFYQDVAPFIIHRNDSVLFYISNLLHQTVDGYAIIGKYCTQKQTVNYDTTMFVAGEFENQIIHSILLDTNAIYGLELRKSNHEFIGNYTHFPNTNLVKKLNSPEIEIDMKHENSQQLTIRSQKPVYGLWIESHGVQFERNAIHLFPGFLYNVNFSGTINDNSLNFRCLNTIYETIFKKENVNKK
jgi:beta-mannosidase